MTGGRGRADLLGFGLLIVSAFCYSSLGILGKIAFAEGLTIVSLLSTRFALGAGILWAFVLIRPGLRAALRHLSPGRVLALLVWGMVGHAGQSFIFFSTLRHISASLTEVLLYTCPAFVAILMWMFHRRRLAAGSILAIGLAMAGTWLAAGPLDGDVDPAGVALGILAGLWYAVFLIVLDRLTPGVPGILSGSLVIAGAAITTGIAAVILGGFERPQSAAGWAALLGMVLTATVLGFALFVAGLKRTGPQVASILSTFEPVGTLALAALVLGERLNATQWWGASFILVAGFVLAANPAREAAAS